MRDKNTGLFESCKDGLPMNIQLPGMLKEFLPPTANKAITLGLYSRRNINKTQKRDPGNGKAYYEPVRKLVFLQVSPTHQDIMILLFKPDSRTALPGLPNTGPDRMPLKNATTLVSGEDLWRVGRSQYCGTTSTCTLNKAKLAAEYKETLGFDFRRSGHG